MVAYKESDPGSLFLRHEAHCLAVPCLSLTTRNGSGILINPPVWLSLKAYSSMTVLQVGHCTIQVRSASNGFKQFAHPICVYDLSWDWTVILPFIHAAFLL